jgi:lipoprotein-anchoring transpeptidase ErfK/SrfK
MVKAFLAALVFANSAYAANSEYDFPSPMANADLSALAPTGPERPYEPEASFSESDFQTKPWLREFTYVAVVNKSTEGKDAQTVRVYVNGKLLEMNEVIQYLTLKNATEVDNAKKAERAKRIAELPRLAKKGETTVFKVSTGRDAFEKKGEHHGIRDSWTITPSGYYPVQALDIKHKSEAYSSKYCEGPLGRLASAILRKELCTYMEYAMFFNRGVAMHKAIPGTEGQLGKKASGGCTRLPAALAEYLFDMIGKTQQPNVTKIPAVKPNGEWNGDYSPFMVSVWGKRPAWSAIVIVHKTVVN